MKNVLHDEHITPQERQADSISVGIDFMHVLTDSRIGPS